MLSESQQEWSEAEHIANLPDVDSAIRGFDEDPSADNGVCMVRAVLRAVRNPEPSGASGTEESCPTCVRGWVAYDDDELQKCSDCGGTGKRMSPALAPAGEEPKDWRTVDEEALAAARRWYEDERASLNDHIELDPDEIRGIVAAYLHSRSPAEPVAWLNGCDKSVPEALEYLANNRRPSGGNERFNAEHLYQLAKEVRAVVRSPHPSAPSSPLNRD